MHRVCGLVLCLLVGTAVTTAALETVTIPAVDGPLTCYIFDSEYIPSTRIPIQGSGDGTFEIPSSEPSFVGHGWGGPLQSRVEGVSKDALCRLLYEHCRFELTLNGARVAPSYMVVWSHECVLEGAEGQLDWAVRYHFDFPAGFFAPGIYVLTGEWRLVNFPCNWSVEGFCASALESGYSVTDGAMNYGGSPTTLTLSVVYP